jgi:hypothetical protein
LKYLLMFIDSDKPWDHSDPKVQQTYGRIGQWFGELAATGKLLGGEELQGAQTATTVRFERDGPVVTDGPFMEAKEAVGGYALLDVDNLDEAIAWAKRWPGAGGPVEIRPIEAH